MKNKFLNIGAVIVISLLFVTSESIAYSHNENYDPSKDLLRYDGGAFFSRDSKQIVWRASRPQGDDAEAYKKLLAEGLVEPKALNIFVADIEGKNVKQVTDPPGANWEPFFHPNGKKVLFCSNHHSIKEGGRRFDIFYDQS